MKSVRIGDIVLCVLDQGSGKPLLLVHGFPLDHSMWGGQIDGLTDVCRVIAPDLRGFGASGVTQGEVSMELMADDLARLLDELDVEEPVILCGLSMGGYVAWQFWRRHPQRLAALILCDTRAAADTEDAARGRRETAARVIKEGPACVAEAMMPKLFGPATTASQSPVIESTRQVMLNSAPGGVAAALLGMAERVDAREWLGEIDLPTLLVCGEHDAISPSDEMLAIANAIPGASFALIPEAGHMAPLENPAAVNTAIREFLAGLAS